MKQKFSNWIKYYVARETYNYAIVNNLYIHKDTKKNLPQEAETDNSIIKNHIKTFLHGSHTGSLHEQYLNVV